MRKIVVFICFFLALLMLTGCLSKYKDTKENVIAIKAEPRIEKVESKSETEQTTPTQQTSDLNEDPHINATNTKLEDSIEIITNSGFTFGIREVDKFKSISIWIDKYEDGKFVESLPALTSSIDSTEKVLINPYENVYNDKLIEWSFTIKQANKQTSLNVALVDQTEAQPGDNLINLKELHGKGTTSFQNIRANLGQAFKFGYIIYDFDNKGVFLDLDLEKVFKENRVVYILMGKLE